jgi:hypothetical protein
MSELITLHVNPDGSVTVPRKILERLKPGSVLVVEQRENDHVLLRLDAPFAPYKVEDPGPRLIREGLATVITGKLEEGFDWDAFMQEGREAPLHGWELMSENASSI